MHKVILSGMLQLLWGYRLIDKFLLRVVLQELPGSLGSLKRLKILAADQNRVVSVSPALLGGCISLATLTLHENPITFEVRRAVAYPQPRSFLRSHVGLSGSRMASLRPHIPDPAHAGQPHAGATCSACAACGALPE